MDADDGREAATDARRVAETVHRKVLALVRTTATSRTDPRKSRQRQAVRSVPAKRRTGFSS